MARTAVSHEINQYIRDNNLQNKTNGRIIVPDSKLAALLKTQPTDELTYFNLQRFMKHHFIKTEVPAVAAATA
jgi:chromatin remodeling complex protein RSC6